MGIPYFEPDINGTVELISRRTVHVEKRDKVVMVYRFECSTCGWDCVRPGLAKLRKAADIHKLTVHAGRPGVADLTSRVGNTGHPDDPPPF